MRYILPHGGAVAQLGERRVRNAEVGSSILLGSTSVKFCFNPTMSESSQALRIDRWLYFCRFFKTRSKASAAVTGGHVRLNGERAAPGNRVQVGDRIHLVRERLDYSIEVTGIPTRRGPAPEARRCYVEDEASVREREDKTAALRQDRLLMPKTEGRPDKHTRRKLRDRKGR